MLRRAARRRPCGRDPRPASRPGWTRGTRPSQRSAGRRRGAGRPLGRPPTGPPGSRVSRSRTRGARPAAARSARGLSAAARPAPSRVAYMPSGPPHAASNAGCMLSRTPSRTSAASVGASTISACSSRCPIRAMASGPSTSTAARRPSSSSSIARSPMTWNPPCTPARVTAVRWLQICSALRYSAPVLSGASVYGDRTAAVCEPSEPSMFRSPPMPGQARDRREDLARVVDRDALLAAVRHEVRQPAGGVGGELEELDQPGPGVDGRRRVLVHGDDAAGGCVLEGAPVEGGPTLRAHLAGGVARGVVGVPLDPAVVAPAREPVEARRGGQRARHHRGVHVDAREVDRRAAGRGVELLAGGRPALGPAQLVPAEAEHGRLGRSGRRAARCTASRASASECTPPAGDRSMRLEGEARSPGRGRARRRSRVRPAHRRGRPPRRRATRGRRRCRPRRSRRPCRRPRAALRRRGRRRSAPRRAGTGSSSQGHTIGQAQPDIACGSGRAPG